MYNNNDDIYIKKNDDIYICPHILFNCFLYLCKYIFGLYFSVVFFLPLLFWRFGSTFILSTLFGSSMEIQFNILCQSHINMSVKFHSLAGLGPHFYQKNKISFTECGVQSHSPIDRPLKKIIHLYNLMIRLWGKFCLPYCFSIKYSHLFLS